MISLIFAAVGDPARAALDKRRARIAEARAEIEAVAAAPLQLSEAVERVLCDLKERAAWSVNSLTTYARPDAPLVFDANERAHRPVDVPLSLPLLFNLVPDVVEKGVRAHLRKECANAGLPLTERGPRVAELKAKLRELLVDEECITIELLVRGIVVDRIIPETADDVERTLESWDRVAA